jgi:putative ABC transport system permease protein
LIVPKTENLSLTYGGLSLGGVSFDMQEIRQEDLGRIQNIKNAQNVAAVGPMLIGGIEVKDHKVLLAGMDFQVYQALRPWWNIQGAVPEKDGVLVGAEAARILDLAPGKRVRAKGRELVVSGVLDSTGSQDDQILFARLDTAQSVLGRKGRISMAEVAALCSGCPIEEMVKQISEILPGANVMAIKQVVKGRMETLDHFRKGSYILSAVVALVGGLVVLVTMMGSVRERTAEIGIFRAVGFRQTHIMRIVLLEAGILSALAGLSGYLAGLGAARLALPFFTEGHGASVSLDPFLAGGAFLLAMVLGLAASIYPSLLAAGMDPNEALRAL